MGKATYKPPTVEIRPYEFAGVKVQNKRSGHKTDIGKKA
jgi:hypothetical protein